MLAMPDLIREWKKVRIAPKLLRFALLLTMGFTTGRQEELDQVPQISDRLLSLVGKITTIVTAMSIDCIITNNVQQISSHLEGDAIDVVLFSGC